MLLISIISYFTFFRVEPIGSLSRAIPVLFPYYSRAIPVLFSRVHRRMSEGQAKDERRSSEGRKESYSIKSTQAYRSKLYTDLPFTFTKNIASVTNIAPNG